jgi:hypothetical protein
VAAETATLLKEYMAKLQTPRRVALNAVTATLVSDANKPWRERRFRNLDAAIIMYWGNSAVTIANGFEMKAGEIVTVETNSPVYMISASGTPSVEVLEIGG